MLVGRTLYYGPVDETGIQLLDLLIPFDNAFTVTAFVVDEAVPGYILLDLFRGEESGTGGIQSGKVPVGSLTFNSNHPARFTVDSHPQSWGLYYGTLRYVPPPSITEPVTVVVTAIGEGMKDGRVIGGGSDVVGSTTNHVGTFTYNWTAPTPEKVRAFAAYVVVDGPLSEDADFTVYEELPNTEARSWGDHIVFRSPAFSATHRVQVASATLSVGETVCRVAVHDAYGLGYRFTLTSADDSTEVESQMMLSAVPL